MLNTPGTLCMVDEMSCLILILILLANIGQNDGFFQRARGVLGKVHYKNADGAPPAPFYYDAARAKRESYANLVVKMVSVGTGSESISPAPKKQVGFIISPSLSTSESEMLIIQNLNQISSGENTKLGIIGTNELEEGHKRMIELLTYALVLSGNHIYTSGGGNGTNRAVINGALRACTSDLLTVILPQSLPKQPADMQSLLMRVVNLIQQPDFDEIDFKEAATLCNDKIISCVDKLLVFAYHDSSTVLKSAFSAEDTMEVTIFYLD